MSLKTTLKHQLDAFRLEFIAKFPEAKAAMMQRAADALAKDYETKVLLQVGDRAPEFTLQNVHGSRISLNQLLQKGPLILIFYRGGWCPYCNLELRAYQQVLPQIKALGASLVAISPQSPDSSLSTVEKNHLEFEVLSDTGSKVAHDYNLAFEVTDELKELYTELGHALPDSNGTPDWQLPVPATFVIDTSGMITLTYIDVDYRNRLEPSEAIAALERLVPSVT
jgi:peroxiredoxin